MLNIKAWAMRGQEPSSAQTNGPVQALTESLNSTHGFSQPRLQSHQSRFIIFADEDKRVVLLTPATAIRVWRQNNDPENQTNDLPNKNQYSDKEKGKAQALETETRVSLSRQRL